MKRLRFSSSAIDFDLLDTWPDTLLRLLSESFDMLTHYERRESEIDRLIQYGAVGERLKHHENIFARERSKVEEQIDAFLATKDLIGYHCTRLLPYESESIKKRGLTLPSREFFANRIRGAQRQRYLSEEQATHLLSINQIDDPGREGICFVTLRSVLSEQYAVFRLFASWGGEAIYNSHEAHPDTGSLLRHLGAPHIIVAQVPVTALQIYGKLSERFIRRFLRPKRRKSVAGSYRFEGRIHIHLEAQRIIDAVPLTDGRFMTLTKCQRWVETIR